ncbi:efflux RND transporter periplasmic adaptor subunit [filamentous cyanobacterium CCT1]|nr:efflux RND transporter periplasmic adaptor subunit [filamentous cyanobacterium CCT1]PSN77368.1 efflux RND transporter periplasmic adaptor subunit [filamentous cyanobacterium CCP4]
MTHSSRSGQSEPAAQDSAAIAADGRDSKSPGQLSLLPEYTDPNHAANNGASSGYDDEPSSGPKWLTLLGLVLLAVVGFARWRWWQGRSAPEQSQQGPQASPVELATVETATVEETSVFTGNLEAEQVSSIQAEQPGRVAQVLVQQGQAVSAGTPLFRLSAEQEQADVAAAQARIDSAQAAQQRARSELEALRAERDRAQAEINLQQEQFGRTSTLVERGALAREELDLRERDLTVARANLNALNRRIQAAQDTVAETQATLQERQASLRRIRDSLRDTTITAPFPGVVGSIAIEAGDYVQAGQGLTQLVANDNLDLAISIPQERAADLTPGLPVEIVDSNGNALQTGQISFISPQVQPDSQFIRTEATFANTGGQLRDGQFVRSEVIWESRAGQPVVPQSAVIYQGEDRFVYVPQDQEGQLVAMRQPVELGLEQGTDVEVLSGLEPGQRIIVAGIQRLGDGAPIQPEGATADGENPSGPQD